MRRRAMRVCGMVVVLMCAHGVVAGAATAATGWTLYVGRGNGTVTPINTATNSVGTPFAAGMSAEQIAITPDGRSGYVSNVNNDSVTVINTVANAAATTISFGANTRPLGVAISPDGSRAYVTGSMDDGLTTIPTATNVAGAPTGGVGSAPWGVAVTPDGKTAYVVDAANNTVRPINTTTFLNGGSIPVGSLPQGIAITPDGKTVYVTNYNDSTVTPIDTATNTAGVPISVGTNPYGIAITPDGRTVYTANNVASGSVTPINTATNTAGAAIPVGASPNYIAITPDSKTAYVTNYNSGSVTPINTATNTPGTAIPVGSSPVAIAITPDQAPTAAFSVNAASAGQPSSFDGSTSSSPVGSIASYRWDFGDGQSSTTTSAHTTHVYATHGSFTARLTVTNTGGTSTTQVFTGQTVSRQGGPQATTTRSVTIVPAVQKLKVSPKKFSLSGRLVGGKCVAKTAGNNGNPHCKRALKLKVTYSLSADATVTFTLSTKGPGRKVKGKCVKPTKKNKGKSHCTRVISLKSKLVKSGKTGKNSFKLSRKLGPGTYQLIATPSVGGQSGTPTKVTFKVTG